MNAVWSSRMQQSQRAMEQASQGTGVTVAKTLDDRLRLVVPADAGFPVGSYNLQPALERVLDALAARLNQDPAATVSISAHTDDAGSDAINDPLSANRAEAVRNHLTAHGVAVGRLAAQGYGSQDPVADNATAAGRATNRRVEIYVTEPAPV